MTDRAHSLFRTVLHPVLSSLRLRAGRQTLPVAPHHAVPVVQLSGVILMRDGISSSQTAEDMYGGTYRFGADTVTALPDTVFTVATPSARWRSALLRMDWLASFRASARPLHALFALRLLSAWMTAHPVSPNPGDRIAALFNLAVDAPAIAATQSPAAIALATAAILRAQHPVSKLKPSSPEEAMSRTMALLAAHLATRRSDSQRDKLIGDMASTLVALLHTDGSLRRGSIDSLWQLHRDLSIILDGVVRSGDRLPAELTAIVNRTRSYLALLSRADGTLAFADDASLGVPAGATVPTGSVFAPEAGHARLVGGPTLLLASAATAEQPQPLRMEMTDAGRPVLWLEQHGGKNRCSNPSNALICAAGGTLLEMRGHLPDAANQHLAIFLSQDGSDVRLEDLSSGGGGTTYVLHVPEQARLTTTHGGAGAMIIPAAGQAWQVLVRGGHIEIEPGCFRIIPDGGAYPLNFALKRLSKVERPGRAAKSRDRNQDSPRLI
jgi:hypothetical protein